LCSILKFWLLLLKRLDCSGFIAVVGDCSLGALLESTELEFLKLDCKFVDLNFVFGRPWEADFELSGDFISEWVTTWTSDRKIDIPDLGFISDHVWKDGEGDGDLDGLLALDFVSDWNVDNINRKSSEILLVVESERASLLPWPESVVKDFELSEDSLSWGCFNDSLGLLLEDGSELVPRFSLLVELLLLLLVLVDHLLLVHTHLGQESTERSGKWIFSWLRFFSVIWENSDHHLWSSTGLSELQERILVAETLLALAAQVVILANGALVANTSDWHDAAAITLDSSVDYLELSHLQDAHLVLFLLLLDVLGIEKVLKYFFGYFLKFTCKGVFSLDLLLVLEHGPNLRVLAKFAEDSAGVLLEEFGLVVD